MVERHVPHGTAPVTLPPVQQRATALLVGASNQPLEHGVEIGLLLCANPVAAHLAVRYGLEIQCLDEVIHRQLVGQIGFIAEHEQRNALQGGLFQEKIQLFPRDG